MANGDWQRGRTVIHTTKARSSTRIRGVNLDSRGCYWARWNEPVGVPNTVRGGPGEKGLAKAIRIRKAAERRIKRAAKEQD
jgi:hypothetical protein